MVDAVIVQTPTNTESVVHAEVDKALQTTLASLVEIKQMLLYNRSTRYKFLTLSNYLPNPRLYISIFIAIDWPQLAESKNRTVL